MEISSVRTIGRRHAIAVAATFLTMLTTQAALAAPRCEVGDAIEGQEIHCFLKAKDGLKQTIPVNSAFPTEVLFELTKWYGPCGKAATRQSSTTKAFKGENKPLYIAVAFKRPAETCVEVAFTNCQAAEPANATGGFKMKHFDCPAALEITP